jgi:hypothetical protein
MTTPVCIASPMVESRPTQTGAESGFSGVEPHLALGFRLIEGSLRVVNSVLAGNRGRRVRSHHTVRGNERKVTDSNLPAPNDARIWGPAEIEFQCLRKWTL